MISEKNVDSRLVDRVGQTWSYMDHPFLFICRGRGPQSSTARFNEWIVLDLWTGRTQPMYLFRDVSLEDQSDRWQRLT